MTPSTEAGRRLFAVADVSGNDALDEILAIEAEARSQERERIAAALSVLDTGNAYRWRTDPLGRWIELVERDAVLRAIGEDASFAEPQWVNGAPVKDLER